MANDLHYKEFDRIEIRTGTIIHADVFKEARKPAIKMQIDFGAEIGVLSSSAQITHFYSHESLVGKQIVAVVNFPPKQIGPLMSECLVLGAVDIDGAVVLLQPERKVENGLRIG